MGVLSEAGCPAIADPGADVVAIAQREGYKVVPLVGPLLPPDGPDGLWLQRSKLRLSRLLTYRPGVSGRKAETARSACLQRQSDTALY